MVSFIPKNISDRQATDTGMAMVLICLLIGAIGGKEIFFQVAIPVLVINMIWPGFYRPVAKVWLGLSHLLGTVVSRILLTVLFFVLVVPVGGIRRMFGADSMQVKNWKKNTSSVFRVRNHRFTEKDIHHPY